MTELKTPASRHLLNITKAMLEHAEEECVTLSEQLYNSNGELSRIRAIVQEQAKDDGLWFMPQTAPEAYLQQELRKLHAAIEGKTPEQCAREALAKWAHDPDHNPVNDV